MPTLIVPVQLVETIVAAPIKDVLRPLRFKHAPHQVARSVRHFPHLVVLLEPRSSSPPSAISINSWEDLLGRIREASLEGHTLLGQEFVWDMGHT